MVRFVKTVNEREIMKSVRIRWTTCLSSYSYKPLLQVVAGWSVQLRMVHVSLRQSASYVLELAILQDWNQCLPQRPVHENLQSIDLCLKQIPDDEVGCAESGSNSSKEEGKGPQTSQLTYSGAQKRPKKEKENKNKNTLSKWLTN